MIRVRWRSAAGPKSRSPRPAGFSLAACATVAFAFAAAGSAYTAAQRFDLVCTGERTDGRTGEKMAERRRYTIDLASERWCRTSECTAGGAEIAEVTAKLISFTSPSPSGFDNLLHYVSLAKGTYVEWMDFTGTRAAGTCQTAPFSGFPKGR